jgi:hypothetical protein
LNEDYYIAEIYYRFAEIIQVSGTTDAGDARSVCGKLFAGENH